MTNEKPAPFNGITWEWGPTCQCGHGEQEHLIGEMSGSHCRHAGCACFAFVALPRPEDIARPHPNENAPSLVWSKHTVPIDLQAAKCEALRRANETGKLFSVVVAEGAALGLLGNNKECEVVPHPAPGRVVMATIGPGAKLSRPCHADT